MASHLKVKTALEKEITEAIIVMIMIIKASTSL
jgi:hypothetical protein